ncbi:MAG: protein kinase [Acidobacteriota bacterium]|nr:protein kinase [Acidobacteriota bacterium]
MPTTNLESFDFPPGRILARKYRVEERLGSGYESEVYRVEELSTGIHRAAKVFFPQHNVQDRAARFYARKLDRLRRCSILVQYHHTETFWHRGLRVTGLFSELVEGQLLEDFISQQRGKRLQTFEALCLLHGLASGLEQIHLRKEYHGDVHDRNVLVNRQGIGFELKLLDFYEWGRPDRQKIREDVIQLVRILYDAVGGRKRYATQPPEIKAICCGLRQDLITRRFPTASHLRTHLETFSWGE